MSIPHTDTDDLPTCCRPAASRRGTGLLWGLFYGLVPHTFCILFVVFSVLGATMASTLVSRILYVPYLFEIIVALSLASAALSAILYLRRNGLLSWRGARRKWRYLGAMAGTTLAVNILFFWVIFPAAANLDLAPRASAQALADQGASGAALGSAILRVAIPCPGHAPLIIGELRSAPGVRTARYESPDLFRVEYDAAATTVEEILALSVFEAFPAQSVP